MEPVYVNKTKQNKEMRPEKGATTEGLQRISSLWKQESQIVNSQASQWAQPTATL